MSVTAPARKTRTAEEMAKGQREISVAEFFAKNRHLLGFDNPKKALLTTIKEAVDNALDACEEAGILPDVDVTIARVGPRPVAAPTAEGAKPDPSQLNKPEKFRVIVRDNGPGIVKEQIPKIFGKLLYGSKFHRMRQGRGQQGIGISAAAMYGQMTTGSAIHILSRTSPKKQAHRFEIHIDTKRNEPAIRRDEKHDWKHPQGTEVEITLEGIYQKGARSVEAYLEETVMANPHVTLRYTNPDGEKADWERAAKELPVEAVEIKPHPYGVELGRFMEMLKGTSARNVKACLQSDFSRVGPSVAAEILAKAKVSPKTKPIKITHDEAHRIHHAITETKIIAPPTNCLSPIGEELLLAGLQRLVKADFYTSVSRKPTVYRGNPFMIECAVAFGGELSGEDPAALHRFANRVPLLYQQGGCATFKAGIATNWRAYGLSQPKGGLPTGPLAILIHIASVWVPFTSEAKEAIASYPEIQKEMRLALQECGRRLGITIRKAAREADANKKRDYIRIFLPQVVEALGEILGLSKAEKEKTAKNLTTVLAKTKVGGLAEKDSA